VPFSYPPPVRAEAVQLVLQGRWPAQAAYQLGVSTATVYLWLKQDAPQAVQGKLTCCRCVLPAVGPQDQQAYAQLLGLYLGDGCLSRGRAAWVLRISCADAWPGVADEVEDMLTRVSGNRVQRVRKAGCHDIQAWWQHWPCLLPQHGPGKKHSRPIVLEPWQQEVVTEHPGPLLRGLFHSDGWRGDNVAVKRAPDGFVTRYRYPRYEFTNLSADIRGICTAALDELGIAWRANGEFRISVARREAVAALDVHVGLKY
jgi:hypothetical protein